MATLFYVGFHKNLSILDFLALLPGNPILVAPAPPPQSRAAKPASKPAKPADKAADVSSRFRWGFAYDTSERILLREAVSVEFYKRLNGEEGKAVVEKALLEAFNSAMATDAGFILCAVHQTFRCRFTESIARHVEDCCQQTVSNHDTGEVASFRS